MSDHNSDQKPLAKSKKDSIFLSPDETVDIIERFSVVLTLAIILLLIFLFFLIPGAIPPNPILDLLFGDNYPAWRDLGRNVITNLIPIGGVFVASVAMLGKYRKAQIKRQNEEIAKTTLLNTLPSFDSISLNQNNLHKEVIALLKQQGIAIEQYNEELEAQRAFINMKRESGFLRTHDNLDSVHDTLIKLLPRSKELRIVSTWLTSTFTLLGKIPPSMEKIQILLLDPTSQAARQRSKDLGYPEAEHVPNLIKETRRIIDNLHMPNLEVLYYSSLPSLPVYICGNSAFFGLFPHSRISDFGPWIEVEIKNSHGGYTTIGGFLISEFEYMLHNCRANNSGQANSLEVGM